MLFSLQLTYDLKIFKNSLWLKAYRWLDSRDFNITFFWANLGLSNDICLLQKNDHLICIISYFFNHDNAVIAAAAKIERFRLIKIFAIF